MSDFFAMGGYAPYVWSAFAISIVALWITVYLVKRNLRRTHTRLRQWLSNMEGTE